MRFEEKLRKTGKSQLWQEYCGFLDMSLDEYMFTQRRLMQEQIRLWSECPLGVKLLQGKKPESLEAFLESLPLTTYEDYAVELLAKSESSLCAKPAIWIQTTWEGGLRPVKTAPYSRGMLDTYRHNLISTMMMASANADHEYDLQAGDRILYGGAPLPYATGLMPSLFDEDIHFEWLPDTNSNSSLSFSERIKKGFQMAFNGGMDYFFGLGSVSNYITENFSASINGSGGGKKSQGITPAAALRFMKGKYISRQNGRDMLPKDVFKLKALFYAGTDAACYKDRLAKAWGVIPTEIAAGTESTCIGAETWEHNGMVFFPDSCFYEFIPEEEMLRNLADPDYKPRTCFIDDVQTGRIYELVISVLHGGAFMRYRIGDMYRCVSSDRKSLPRFAFVDRCPNVIDIAGFTRITEHSVQEVIKLSHLQLGDWVLKKENDDTGVPYLHMYLEIPAETQMNEVTTKSVLTDCLSVYFKYFDSDYSDLKTLLNIEPLKITILKCGTIKAFENRIGQKLRRINPSSLDVSGMLKEQERSVDAERWLL